MAGTPLRELLAAFGFEFDQNFERQATASVANVIGAVQSLGQAFVGSAIVGGAAAFVQNMISVGSELADTSAQMGISATELAEWRYAARLAGVEATELSSALARVAVLARAGGGGIFGRLGVSTRDANGELRRASDILEDVGVAIGELDNETERTAIATQVFGRAGRALIPLFRGTRGSIRELRAEVRRLYGTDLDRLAEVADEAGDNQDRLSLVMDAFRTRIALSVLPIVTELLEGIAGLGTQFAEIARRSQIVEVAVAALGGLLVGVAAATAPAWGPPVLTFLAFAAAIAFVLLLVEDIVTLFDGGRSVIGSFIDELFGIGAAEAMVARVQTAFSELVDFWSGDGSAAIIDGWDRVQARIQEVLDFWSEGFGRVTTALNEAGDFWSDVFGGGGGGDGPTAVPAVAGETTVDASRNVGAIYVNGSGTPEATARAVVRAAETARGSGVEDAALDLVPEAG